MSKILVEGSKIIIDGHAKDIETCNTLTNLCDDLATSDKFVTIKYENGYGEFDSVSENSKKKFVMPEKAEACTLTIYSEDGSHVVSTIEIPASTAKVTSTGITWVEGSTTKKWDYLEAGKKFNGFSTVVGGYNEYTPGDTITMNSDKTLYVDAINVVTFNIYSNDGKILLNSAKECNADVITTYLEIEMYYIRYHGQNAFISDFYTCSWKTLKGVATSPNSSTPVYLPGATISCHDMYSNGVISIDLYIIEEDFPSLALSGTRKFLSKNGKLFIKNNQFVKQLYPQKGDLINIDLGNGDKTYRILKSNENTVEVVAMYEPTLLQKYNATNKSSKMGGVYIFAQQYSGSDLDTYLNTTWYNTLSDIAKAAIIAQDIIQDVWYLGSSTALGNPVYSGTYGDEVPGTSKCTIGKYADGGVIVGSRNVYALSVQDVVDYLNDSAVLVDTTAMLRNVNIWKMFWNIETKPNTSFWLRSANGNYSYRALYVNSVGTIWGGSYSDDLAVRPAFCIDLNKIPFIKTTEVIT